MVLQLQELLYNDEITTLEALRKAHVISKKLKIKNIRQWIEKELNGYNNNEKVPEYRKVRGFFEARNPYHGWIPIIDYGQLQKIETVYVTQTIIELEDFVKNCKSGFVQINRNDLSKLLEIALPVRHNISIQQIVKITESVKNKILDWTLELEEKGIKGENMSFSEKEKEKVKEMGDTITNVYGNQQIMQNSINSTQTINVNDLKKELSNLIEKLEEGLNNQEFYSKVSENELKEIREEVQTLKMEVSKADIDKTLVAKSINFMKEIFMRTTTSLIAGGLLNLISKIQI